MTLIQTIKELIEQSCNGYSFQFDTDRMMNVLSDDQKFPCVFFEEYTDGSINLGYGYHEKHIVELSFMDLADFQCDAIEREVIRERLKQDAVIPFIKALQGSGKFEEINSFVLMAEPPRFDANAVSLLLRFEVKFPLCL